MLRRIAWRMKDDLVMPCSFAASRARIARSIGIRILMMVFCELCVDNLTFSFGELIVVKLKEAE